MPAGKDGARRSALAFMLLCQLKIWSISVSAKTAAGEARSKAAARSQL